MSGDRTLSITIVAPTEKAQKELAKLADSCDDLGLKVARSGEKVATASKHSAEFGERTRGAFDAVQAAATSVGASLGPVGEIVEGFSASLEHVDEHASRVHRSLQIMGGVATAIGGIIAIEAAADEAAMAQLRVAVENTGKSWDEYETHLHHAATSQAEYGHSAKDATEALTKLTAAFNDPEQAMEKMQVTADLAARNHISLADAAGLVARVHAGAFKTLTQFGIVVKDLIDPTKELAAAQRDSAIAATQVQTATERLGNFEANLQQQRSAGEEAHAQRVEAATQRVATAQEHLADVQQSTAQRRKASQEAADEAVTSTTQKLADARQHLADVEQQVHEATTLSLQDQQNLRDAQESVSDVQQQIADGQLSGAEAAKALREANERLADTQAEQAEKSKQTTSQQATLRAANEAVTKATDDHSAAQAKAKTAGQETTAEAVALRKALEGVAAAHDAVAKAEASSSGGATLQQLQEEQTLRENLVKAQDKQAKAARELAKAKADEENFGAKTEAALKLLEAKVKGSADAQARTVSGMFHRWVAEAQNAFAGLGPAVGLGLVAAASALQIGMALMETTLLSTLGDMLGAALIAVGGFFVDAAAAALPLIIEFAPLVVAIAAIGIVAYELYKHWHQIWGFIKDIVNDGVHFVKDHLDWVIAVAFGPFGIAIKLIKDHWDSIWGAIKSSASSLAGFFTGAFKGLANIVLTPWRLIIDGVNGLIRGLDSIQIHIPSVLGIGGFDWNGLGLSQLPQIPKFQDGGLVPGADGAPTLIMAHGGERVLNRAQQAAQWGGSAGQRIVIEVNVNGALITDRRSADALGQVVADGVHKALLQKQSRQPLGLTGRRQ